MRPFLIILNLLLTPLAAATAADPTTTLWFDRPVTNFHQSLPLGNGRIGAMVYGGSFAAPQAAQRSRKPRLVAAEVLDHHWQKPSRPERLVMRLLQRYSEVPHAQ